MLCEANEFDIYLLLFRKKSRTNWWLILGKCIETIPGRHQETLPIWPWLLQCIRRCQESKSVITATRCMNTHAPLPSIFCIHKLKLVLQLATSSRAHKARAMHWVHNGAPRALGDQRRIAPLWLPPPCPVPGRSLHLSHSLLHALRKLRGHHRAASSQRLCSWKSSAVREDGLLFQVIQQQTICYYGAARCQQCTAQWPCAKQEYSKEHESILTRHLRHSNDGPQLFHLD